jgi:hypothetical protein
MLLRWQAQPTKSTRPNFERRLCCAFHRYSEESCEISEEVGVRRACRINGAAGPSAKPMTNGNSCAESQQAIADTNNRRHERRVDLQTRLHTVGFGILPPVPIQQVQPESAANQQAAQSSGKPKVKEGTVILAMAVGVEGKVSRRSRGSVTRRCARPKGNRKRAAMDVFTSTAEWPAGSRSD